MIRKFITKKNFNFDYTYKSNKIKLNIPIGVILVVDYRNLTVQAKARGNRDHTFIISHVFGDTILLTLNALSLIDKNIKNRNMIVMDENEIKGMKAE